jgi:hypothetical protein
LFDGPALQGSLRRVPVTYLFERLPREALKKERTMKKYTPKKLTLSRETLHLLADEQIRVAGAGRSYLCDPPTMTDTQQHCCA